MSCSPSATEPSGAADAYALMAAAIRHIEATRTEPDDLTALAAAVGVSPFHFQRTFSRWVGLSPARFRRFLTLADAKALLAKSMPVLETALEVGLSGPARLHDLCVAFEAVTPGEAARSGAGLVIRWGVHDSPFGPMLLQVTPRGVCGLDFLEDAAEPAAALDRARRRWPGALLVEDAAASAPVAARMFAGRAHPEAPPLRVVAAGTNFQVQVWQALLRIPEGQVASYHGLARALGRPEAVRAVAGAVARNPVGYLIPCHRVIRATGAITGYAWGTERKRALLTWETARTEAATQAAAAAQRTARPSSPASTP